MRTRTILAAAFLLGAGVAQAQISPLGGSSPNRSGSPAPAATPAPAAPAAAPDAGPAAAPAARAHRAHRTLAERFSAANTTHDGKLTLDQARAGHMVAVARDFDKIDKDKDGTVTMDEIKSFQADRRAARRAARAPAQQ